MIFSEYKKIREEEEQKQKGTDISAFIGNTGARRFSDIRNEKNNI